MRKSVNSHSPYGGADAPVLACDETRKPSVVACCLLYLIRFYQRFISAGNPGCCRFDPTCSVYAAEAIRRHGALKGVGLALWRILRCNPFCRGGYDPVPDKKSNGHSVRRSSDRCDDSGRKARKEAT